MLPQHGAVSSGFGSCHPSPPATTPAVIPEGVKCGRRDRIDRVGADQLFHVEGVAVGRILRARARPEQPLRLRASGSQRFPARRRDDRLVPLVGELRIRNRNLTLQAAQPLTPGGARDRRRLSLDLLVDGGVDTAHEEAGDAGDPRHIPTGCGVGLQAGERRLGHFGGRTRRAATGRGQRLGVIGAAGNRLLEDRGVRRHAAEAVLLDQTRQLTARDQMAPDVVEPHGLAQSLQPQQRIRTHRECFSTSCFAAATRWSGVKRNFFCSASG